MKGNATMKEKNTGTESAIVFEQLEVGNETAI